jgi:hypothetical protein
MRVHERDRGLIYGTIQELRKFLVRIAILLVEVWTLDLRDADQSANHATVTFRA